MNPHRVRSILQAYVNRYCRSNIQWDYRESSITIDLNGVLKDNNVIGVSSFVSGCLKYRVIRIDIFGNTFDLK